MIIQAFELMLYGLGGVFTALGMLFIVIKVLVKLFPEKE